MKIRENARARSNTSCRKRKNIDKTYKMLISRITYSSNCTQDTKTKNRIFEITQQTNKSDEITPFTREEISHSWNTHEN